MSQLTVVEDLLQAMNWRCIGPPRGGRVVAVAGDPLNPAVFYFGAVAGGVWKTDDAGTTWRNISDGYFRTSAVGALAVSPSNPNIIYAGMGESTIRTDVSHGDGLYKSTDRGQTWTHVGLRDTRYIGKVRIHPKNPETVFVAALGHAFGRNEERGVFRSRDGGVTWEKVLYTSDKAGAVDLTFDTNNPDVLYASIWETYRNFWELSSGGPDSGLWKSSDGGNTWTEISRKPGLPKGLLGKIGVSASSVQAGRVWAVIEAKDKPGFFRSDDYGETWVLLNDLPDLRQRPWYYCHVCADPQDGDTVYVLNLDMWKSSDGGKTFAKIGTPHGDNHDLWINPQDNRCMVQGNDGGACVSFNGGKTFSTIYNQLTAQFYHVAVDNQFPYHVYGTQQDNSSICVPSDTISGAISWSDCYAAGTGESGYITVHPHDSNIVYVGAVGSSPGGLGALQRYDHSSGQIRLINVWPEAYGGTAPKDLRYRFPWTYPILFSPHDPNVLYTCANIAFCSTDEGHSWTPFSPDLTRADESKMEASGGPITLDTSGAEHYATISAFCESPHEIGVFWSGSDDGLVQLSRDGGKSWENVTPPDLPPWSFICTVEPSPHDPATLYLAATRYKLDDPAPHLYKSDDYGATWQKITDGIPADDFTRVIRADPVQPNLLYAGTETGLYISLDEGDSWQRWQGDLPVTPIYDLLVKDSDLVVATHGRSFWILDDLTPLRQYVAHPSDDTIRLFAPRTTHRILPDLTSNWTETDGRGYALGLSNAAIFDARRSETGHVQREFLDAGKGVDRGAIIYYHLPEALDLDKQTTLDVLDNSGDVVRSFAPKPEDYDTWDDKQKSMDTGPWIPLNTGGNRFTWDLRHSGSERVPGNKTALESLQGPFVVPGVYQVRLTVGDQSFTHAFEVVNDPRVNVSQVDLEVQLALLLRIRNKISDGHRAVNRLRDVRDQVQNWRHRLVTHDEIVRRADTIIDALNTIEDILILPGEQKNPYDLVERSRLCAALATLISVVASADARPTTQSSELVAKYSAQIDSQIAYLEEILRNDVRELNEALHTSGTPMIIV